MSAEPNILISFAAGILSFLSPCILPLIPSYLSYIGGVSASDLRTDASGGRRVLFRTLFFIAGFTAVFVILGILFSGSGLLFSPASRIASIVSGGIVVVLGVHLVFDLFKFLSIERRIRPVRLPEGIAGAFLLGMAFAGGWSPCVGPILSGILFLAGQSGTLWLGAVYLLAYSVGLGLPFILAGMFFDRFMGIFSRLKRSVRVFQIIGGAILIGIGLLMITGKLQAFNAGAASFGYIVQTASAENGPALRLITGGIMTAGGVILFLSNVARRGTRNTTAPADQAAVKTVVRRKRTFPGLVSALFVAAGVLQAAGIIDLVRIFTEWLTFQGI